jgi:hypothetical protein
VERPANPPTCSKPQSSTRSVQGLRRSAANLLIAEDVELVEAGFGGLDPSICGQVVFMSGYGDQVIGSDDEQHRVLAETVHAARPRPDGS